MQGAVDPGTDFCSSHIPMGWCLNSSNPTHSANTTSGRCQFWGGTMPGSLWLALTKCHWGHAAKNDSKHGKWLSIIALLSWSVMVGQPGLWKTWHTTTDWCTHNHAASIYAFKWLIYIFVVIKFARKSLSGDPCNMFCGLAQAAPEQLMTSTYDTGPHSSRFTLQITVFPLVTCPMPQKWVSPQAVWLHMEHHSTCDESCNINHFLFRIELCSFALTTERLTDFVSN